MRKQREPARRTGDADFAALRRALGATVLTLALLGVPVRGQSVAADGTIEDPVHIPAGVIDAGGTVGCLRSPEGGVQAIDLKTGRSLWRSAAPSRALSVARGQAFVLEERDGSLRVAAYRARPGKLERAYDLAALTLPPWASLAEPDEERQSTVFQVTARLAGDTIEIRYDVTRRQVFGFARPGVVGRVQGLARVALGSGRVEVFEGPGPSPPPISEPAPPMPGVRLVAVHARAPDATIVLSGPPANVEGALVAGSRRLAFELSPDTKTVIVHSWKAPGGEREPPLRLEHGHATDAVWATIDRRHVLLRRAYAQQWYDLYSLDSGAPMSRLERPVDVAVIGPRVYWTTHRADGGLDLVATDSASGRRLWRRNVREPEPHAGSPVP